MAVEVDGEVRRREILSKDERDLEQTEREEIESDGEIKENKKTLNQNGIVVRTLSYLRALSSLIKSLKCANAKYLAHLTHQTQKQTLISCVKCFKILRHTTIRSQI